jgi:hypothetical protein
MREFCTGHSEGRKWYLEMKNYSAELLDVCLTGANLRVGSTRAARSCPSCKDLSALRPV